MEKKKETKAKKDHHYVPIGYIKNFCLPTQVLVADFREIRQGYNTYPKNRTPGQICYQKNYYTIYPQFFKRFPEYADLDTLHIEDKTFQRLENAYGKIYNNIRRNRALEVNEAVLLADFILQLKIRNPFHRINGISKNIAKLFSESGLEIEKDLKKSKLFGNIPQTVRHAILNQVIEEHINDSDSSTYLQFHSLLSREKHRHQNTLVQSTILKFAWKLLIAEDECSFVSTDNPGISVDILSRELNNTRFIGNFHYYFPLSGKYCLLIDGTEIDKQYLQRRKKKILSPIKVDNKRVEYINNCSTQVLNDYVFGCNKVFLKGLIEVCLPAFRSKIKHDNNIATTE